MHSNMVIVTLLAMCNKNDTNCFIAHTVGGMGRIESAQIKGFAFSHIIYVMYLA